MLENALERSMRKGGIILCRSGHRRTSPYPIVHEWALLGEVVLSTDVTLPLDRAE
jgi:hypothetical protein